MSFEQYWYYRPNLLNNYANVHKKKAKDKMDWIDAAGHLFGAYNSKALSSVPIVALPIMEKISKNKLQEMLEKYPKKPLNILSAEIKKNTLEVESKPIQQSTLNEIRELQKQLANAKK